MKKRQNFSYFLLFSLRKCYNIDDSEAVYTKITSVFIPEYYRNFVCKCGECRHVCCKGWGISVSEAEYFRLVGLSCPKKLRRKLDVAFHPATMPDEARFAMISPDYEGNCPMLDGDGYCLLQKECGESVLPLICRVYPRSVKHYGERTELCLSSACEETVELLLSDTEPVKMVPAQLPLPFDGISVYGNDPGKDAVREDVQNILRDRSMSIKDRIEKIGRRICKTAICPGNEPAAALDEIRRFLSIFERHSLNILECDRKVTAYLGDIDDVRAYEKFRQAEDRMRENIPEIDCYAEKLLTNHVIYEGFPYVRECSSPQAAFSAFCFVAALMKFLSVCGTAIDIGVENLTDMLAAVFRFVEHTDFYAMGNNRKMPSPADSYRRLSCMFE